MNVTWILGNGFDVALGLKTKYRTFVDKVYLNPDREDSLRDKLVKRVGDDRTLSDGSHWSDLETLLGRASSYYEGEVNLFNDTFEEMQDGFIEYVHAQELRLPEDLTKEAIGEFRDSICRFFTKFVQNDRRRFPISEGIPEHIRYRFISLNYTTALDRLLAATKRSYSPIYARRVGGSVFNETVEDVLHLHGSITDGNQEAIVFGVSEASQIACKAYADSPGFCELWVKSNKNDTIYGNDKNALLKKIVTESNVLCIYGCSLGETDKYIWREVGQKLLSDRQTFLVLFVHRMPDRLSGKSSTYQHKRDEALARFAQAAGIDEDDFENVQKRIVLLPSEKLFRFDKKLCDGASSNGRISTS